MKLKDKERVAGTRVTIGRRVQRRRGNGQSVERVTATFTAEYIDVDGRRRAEGLGVTHRREARRKALEIQQRLDEGRVQRRRTRLKVADLIEAFQADNESRGLAPKTLAKYKAELDKLALFCKEEGIRLAERFDERAYHRFGAWLRAKTHKQGSKYAGKTLYTTLTVCKQVFKWAWRMRMVGEFQLVSVKLPSNRPRSQPCFTTEQIEALLSKAKGVDHAAIAILAYAGLRVGELSQLRWEDVQLELGELGMLHIRRGGSGGATKDKEARFVPIHPRVRPILESLPRSDPLVLPELKDRTLLTHLKGLCVELGFGSSYKVHSLRHHFASMCANTAIPYRMALAWMGHSGSDVLDLYYHLHDAESAAAMRTLAERTESMFNARAAR